jgi:hypothetical protein
MKEEREQLRRTRANEFSILSNPNILGNVMTGAPTHVDGYLNPVDLKVGNGAIRNNLASELFTRRVIGMHIASNVHNHAYPEPYTWLRTITSFARNLKQAQKKHINEIGVGQTHTVIVDHNHDVYTLGLNDCGQLGHNNRKDVFGVPQRVSSIGTTVSTAEMMWLRSNSKAPERSVT